ncbi:penicillin-binding protein 2 [Arthrobacter zhangbolii]|uniref:Penicillin-binding protein 2 n=1 Tax=Arthrobacter zhangbolii TaxID=2886936 RepID=A0A9X1M7U5_9MICC|nr:MULTISPECIES: penicillin-binding protein 2 [Arthrobacter]MCC3271909.1 penicillin-binding protein 2 [Arthrobacter zhangbolii]MCC3293815.1 penicillin-binding protein 2 [Arthrobacter zhangbolii]MDN3904985.1 penicillin-binding protein 2 [Arthrobacter sp. YD2]UON93272.1 penicillin-binding protein 2 [Arthrobacter zhangbolii]
MAQTSGPNNHRVALVAKRLRIGLVAALVLLTVLGLRLFHVQALDPAGMAEDAVANRLTTVSVPALRGSILDANGNYLARSVERFDIVVDQRLSQPYAEDEVFQRRDSEGVLQDITFDQGFEELAAILGQDTGTLRSSVLGEKGFNFVAKTVTPEIKEKVLAVKFPGIYADRTTLRTYPSGAVAGSIVGFLGTEGAQEGLELTQDEILAGKAGSKTYEIGGDGIRIPYATNEDEPVQDGQSIKLSIDQDLQWFSQQTISAQVEEYNAEWGNIVVMEAETGRVVALAESTTVDPNNPGATPAESRKARTVTDSFEPGSTTKVITMAAAIEEGLITPESQFAIGPNYTVDGQTFKDAAPHGDLRMTASGVLAKSLNTGTVMIGQQLTPRERYDWLRKFGIGQPLNVGLNGETSGILSDPDEWDTRQQYTVLFGQGLTQTALHTASVYQTIANDGVRIPPSIIDSVIDEDGTEKPVEKPEATRVVSKETAGEVRRMLETVTVDGSGATGALEQYRVGSKTGTAEAPGPNGGYSGSTLSYAGIAPLEDPKYVVVVTLQRPQGDLYYIIPGQSFQKVMEQALVSSNVPPSTGKPETYPIEY